ncbi:MAG: hypothetical protein LAO05_13325 [Acidobacteriia bacterium]|nr:hypothetical protein [Terriglobia bacterium]
MDPTTALWIVVPLALVHIVIRRRRVFLLFQLAVDIALLLLPGRLLLVGDHIGPGSPGAAEWGGPATVAGSPEQSDLPLEFAVWWEEVRRLTGSGEPPWISDRIGGGTPLYANGQTGLPFPLHLPVWALGAERGSDVMAVWKLELAALGGFLLLLRLGVRPAAAASGALAYAFGVYQVSWLVVPLAWVVALAPWALWTLIGTLRGDRRSGAWLALILGTTAGWSAHPETAAFLWLAVALAGTVLAWGRARRIFRLAVPYLLALLVAAVGSLPVVATISGSSKLAASRAGPPNPDPGLSWSVKGRAAALFLVPWRDGNPGAGTWHQPFPCAAVSVSVGVVPLLMMLGAPLRRRHRRAAVGLAVVGVGAASMVYQLPVVSHLLGRLPVLGAMTWVRSGFLIGLSAAFLGALGLDAWLHAPRRLRLAAAAVVAEGVVLALALTGRAASARETVATIVAPAAVGVAVAAGAGPLAIPVLVGVESVANAWSILGASREVSSPPGMVAELRARATGGGRLLGLGDALPPNLPARYGLADLRSADPVRPLGLARLHQALGARGMDLPGPVTTPWAGLAGAWGVRWLATPPEGVVGSSAAGWEEVWRDAGGRIYRNSRALPVLRLASATSAPPGDPGAGAWERVDFAATAVTTEVVKTGGEGSLAVIDDRPWRHVVRVRSQGTVLAVLHVPRAAGWRTYLDGRAAATVDADLGAMAVVIPTGDREVRWEYSPPFLLPGVILTAVGLLACLALGVSSPRRSR